MEFDPALPHQGPFVLPGGRVEVRTVRQTLQGPETKITVLDTIHALVLQQRVLDPRGYLVAGADAAGHRRDPQTGVVLPTVVSVWSVPAQVAMRLELSEMEVNRLPPDAADLWTMPNYPGSLLVDFAARRLPLGPPCEPGVGR